MALGDHIYVHCTKFIHHGIDCGDGTVIHYDGAKIAQVLLSTFNSGKQHFIKQYGKCDPSDVVLQRAMSRLNEEKYDLLFNNCEHFATWCKTGQHASEQVKNAGATVTGASGSGAAVAAGIGVVGATGAAAGLSGAGVMSGLATVGGVVGGGAIAGVGVLGSAPGLVTKMAMDQVLKDDETLPDDEREARAVGRTMTTLGAVAGTAGAIGAVSATGVAGLSAAGITSGLAAVGGAVGGGMVAGVAITAAAPAVAAAAVGYGAYKFWKWISE